MNNSFQSYFDKAELALAAYSDFLGLPKISALNNRGQTPIILNV